MGLRYDVDTLIIMGDHAPNGRLHVGRTTETGFQVGPRMWDIFSYVTIVNHLANAVAGNQTAVQTLRKWIMWNSKCQLGCQHEQFTKENNYGSHLADGELGYMVILQARLVQHKRRTATVLVDYQHPLDPSNGQVASLKNQFKKYDGYHGADAKASKAQLTTEISNLYRSLIEVEATAQRLELDSLEAGNQVALEQAAAWRKDICALNAKYAQQPIFEPNVLDGSLL